MNLREPCASKQYAECESQVGKRSHKTCGRADGGRRQKERWVVAVYSVGVGANGEGRGKKREERESESKYGKVEGDGIAKTGCCQQDVAFRFARRMESSSSSDSPGRFGAAETYSSENVSTPVIEVTSPGTWQKVVTAK